MRKPAEFVLQPVVQEMFNHFCSIWGIRIAFFGPDGEQMRVGKNRPECLYCRLLRKNLGYEDKCLALARSKQDEAMKTHGIVLYRCHGGMNESLVPVLDNSRLLGFMMIGQFHTEGGLPETIQREWAEKYGNVDLEEAFSLAPHIDPGHVEHVLALFRILVNFVVSQQMIDVRQEESLQPIVLYMQQNFGRNITLAEVAAIAHRSPSTLSHFFHRVLGQSFKRVQIEMKLDRAERLLRTNPQITVREVAYRLGYQDPLYFSRLFKKHRNATPTSCRLRPPE
jgi:AraC-like DNA-binding protein